MTSMLQAPQIIPLIQAADFHGDKHTLVLCELALDGLKTKRPTPAQRDALDQVQKWIDEARR